MEYYDNIPIWENNYRLRKLSEFTDYLKQYYNSANEEAKNNICLSLQEVHDIILCAGINPYLNYTPPPMIGGYIQNIDVVLNFDNLRCYGISERKVYDFILMAVGVYLRDKRKSWIRTFNPFYWLGRIIECIASIPFWFLGHIGFDRYKIETSLLGKITKGIFKIVIFLSALLPILDLLGLLEPIKAFFKLNNVQN
jgi:hypothetical protein